MLNRHPNIHFALGVGEAARHHAHDVVVLTIQADLAIQDIARPAEPALPQTVADDDHGSRSVLVLLASEWPAQQRLDAEGREQTPRADGALDSFRHEAALGATQVELILAFGGHRREAVALRLPVQEIGECCGTRSSAFLYYGPFKQQDQLVRLRVRQVLEQRCIDDAEDARIRSNAERQREERDQHKARRFPERAPGITDVLNESFHCSYRKPSS